MHYEKSLTASGSLYSFFILQKTSPPYPFEQENIAVKGLTDQQDSIIAAQPTRKVTPPDIVFEDGETLEAFLKRLDLGTLSNWENEQLERCLLTPGFKRKKYPNLKWSQQSQCQLPNADGPGTNIMISQYN